MISNEMSITIWSAEVLAYKTKVSSNYVKLSSTKLLPTLRWPI